MHRVLPAEGEQGAVRRARVRVLSPGSTASSAHRKVPVDTAREVARGEPPDWVGTGPIELGHRHHRPPAALSWQTVGGHQRCDLRWRNLLVAKLVARIAEQLEARTVLRMQLGERSEGGGGEPSFGRRVGDDDGLACEGAHLERATRQGLS